MSWVLVQTDNFCVLEKKRNLVPIFLKILKWKLETMAKQH